MKEIIPIGSVIEYQTKNGSVALQTFISKDTIGVKRIEVSQKRQKLGTQIVNDLINLATQQNKKLVITDTMGSEKFWDTFNKLKKTAEELSFTSIGVEARNRIKERELKIKDLEKENLSLQ